MGMGSRKSKDREIHAKVWLAMLCEEGNKIDLLPLTVIKVEGE